MPEIENNPSMLPYISIEAVAHTGSGFNWNDQIIRTLHGVDEVLIHKKIDYRTGKPSAAALQYVLENVLKNRRVSTFFLDEAQHLQKVSSGRQLLDQLDTIKSLANHADTKFILSGPYDLLKFRDLNDQLTLRSFDVHFPRYITENKEDVEAFQNIILSFQRHIPLRHVPDLVSRWDYLYAFSLGCVGILKNWLLDALQLALDDESDEFMSEYLEETRLNSKECNRLFKNLKEKESIIKPEGDEDKKELYASAGFRKADEALKALSPFKPEKSRSKPFERTLGRDSVGRDNNKKESTG